MQHGQSRQPEVFLEPQREIVFVCGPANLSGILKFYITANDHRKSYQFEVKATNKSDYKVSQPKGTIRTSPYTVYFYFKGHHSLTRNLRDKFLIVVRNKQTDEIVLSQKMTVLIESALPSKKDKILPEGSLSNATKFASVYTTPAANSRTSMMISNMGDNSSQNRFMMSPGAFEGNSRRKQREQVLKTQLNDTIQVIQKSQRKIILLDRERRNRKAQSRFSIYLTVFLVLLAFALGWYAKSINFTQFFKTQVDKMKNIVYAASATPSTL